MNPDTVAQTIQKGFRITLGATTTLVESLQDSQRRTETLNKLQANPTQLVEELEAKGAVTEREARSFVDTLLSQQTGGNASQPTTSAPTTSTTVAAPEIQLELKELTAQIAAIRAELEKLRVQGS
jgi:polyhydroxyalkanoate synthesis regulator phasin